jgi:hypothetical protein
MRELWSFPNPLAALNCLILQKYRVGALCCQGKQSSSYPLGFWVMPWEIEP